MTLSDPLAGDDLRRIILEQSNRAHVGHIGSALSIADLVATLFGRSLRLDGRERDRFILSKGHAVLALYAALHAIGRLDEEALNSYCGEGTALGSHPEHRLAGIDFSTGSLGHGLPIATGAALAARLDRSQRRTFVLMSDAECNEGAVWEAAMFAAHHRLGNLVAMVDVNGQQALGATRDVLDLEPLAERWLAFGWDVHEVDGHDEVALGSAIDGLDTDPGSQPHILLAATTFGKGVSFMEGRLEWHYFPMSDEQYVHAMEQLGGGREG